MKILIANWKMNYTTFDGLCFIKQFLQLNPDLSKTKVMLAPSFVSIFPLQQEITRLALSLYLCAQNIHWETRGAFTGEISAEMILSAGCSSVLIGHSERRNLFQETNEIVFKKFQTAMDYKLQPYVCFGEPIEIYKKNETLPFIAKQLELFLPNQNLFFAYEPIWSIGTGLIPSKSQIEDVIQFVKNLFPHAKVLYGGSVNTENIGMLCSLNCIDGFLVGGASLIAESFFSILKSINKYDTCS